MQPEEIVRLVQAMAAGVVAEIAEVASVAGSTATVKRLGQTVATKPLPVAVGLNLAVGERVVLLRRGPDLNSAVIVAKLTGGGLAAATAATATSASSATNADKTDGIHFRNNAGTLQWSENGVDWYNT